MADIAKVIRVIGQSEESFAEAARGRRPRGGEDGARDHGADVVEMSAVVENDQITMFRTTVEHRVRSRALATRGSPPPNRVASFVTRLRSRAHEDLVDVHVRRLPDRVEDGARDVVRLERVRRPGCRRTGCPPCPGSISVTRTPVPFSSCRAASPIAVTAHFVAA